MYNPIDFGRCDMIPGAYAIYQSEKSMEDFYRASQLAPMKQIHGHYISEETATANLELALLYHKAHELDIAP